MQRSRQWFLTAAISTTFLAAAIAVGWFLLRPTAVDVPKVNDPATGGSVEHAPESSELPPLSAVRFLNAAPGVAYINSEACAKCHAAQGKSYLQTGHAQSFSLVDVAEAPPDGEVAHPDSNRRYKIERRDGALRQQEFLKDEMKELLLGDYAATLAFGSGHHALGFAVEKEGCLFQSPLTWHRRDNEWKMSPGYDHRQQKGFTRPIQFECVNCHAGRVEVVDNTLKKFRLHEQRIGCERCHGPGDLHATAHAGKTPRAEEAPDDTIVHPGRLSRRDQESICAQCHLSTVAEVDLRGRSVTEFRPGRSLSEYHVHFREKTEDKDDLAGVGHIEQLRRSRCYQGSETLSCSTCHDPHATVPAEQRIERYRSKCLTCHSAQDMSCGLPLEKRRLATKVDDCVKCHMPRGESEIPHVALTHHRIGIHTPKPWTREAIPDLPTLVPLEDLSALPPLEQDRLLGLAYLHAAWKQPTSERVREALGRARPLLEDVVARGLHDGVVETALAQIALDRQDVDEALKHAQAALSSAGLPRREREEAWRVLGISLLRTKQFAAAEDTLKKVTAVQFECNDWYALGNAQYAQKKLPEALKSVQNAALADPLRMDVQQTLGKLYFELKRPDDARLQLDRINKLFELKPKVEPETGPPPQP